MNFPDELRPLLIERIGKNPGWFADQYAKAVERIEDRTSDPENPYYYSALNDQSAFNDDPPLTVKTYKGNVKAREVTIHGPSKLVYRPDQPLDCGAHVWIETQAEVETK